MDWELCYQLSVGLSVATITLANGEIARLKREYARELRSYELQIRLLHDMIDAIWEQQES